MSLPVVAIVGRPNVGKSTLVNRIITSQEAIVDKKQGVTRDRIYYLTDWRGTSFTLIDTGGLQFGKLLSLSQLVQQQALTAIGEAAVIIFLVDATAGIMLDDEEIARILRASAKPVLLVVNKVDLAEREVLKHDFFRLGLGEPFDISASHGRNIGDLLDLVIENFPSRQMSEEAPRPDINIAIVGRPNVGKSSLFNQLLSQERVIVNEMPGTTRDAIDTLIEFEGKRYRFIDTAGLKKTSKKIEDIDYYGMVRTLRALDRTELVLLVIDAAEGITAQDQKIADLIANRGCAAIIIMNKWDLLDRERKEAVRSELAEGLRFVSFLPSLGLSALTGQGVNRIFGLIEKVAGEYNKRISTSKLNSFLQDIKSEGYSLTKGGRNLKISYVTQARTSPPGFVFFVNHPELVGTSYKRYLENRLRKSFSFQGSPMRLYFKSKRQ